MKRLMKRGLVAAVVAACLAAGPTMAVGPAKGPLMAAQSTGSMSPVQRGQATKQFVLR